MATGMQRATGWKESGRQADDFYSTPEWAINALLDKEEFKGQIWEPASGDGAISKILEARGLSVFSSDLRTEGVYGEGGKDFLKEKREGIDAIITNPPFKLALPFILHGLNQSNKVAIFGRIQLLEGLERHERLWSKNPPKAVYVFSGRCSCLKDGRKVEAGLMCFAWFVWEKGGENSEPVIRWILPPSLKSKKIDSAQSILS